MHINISVADDDSSPCNTHLYHGLASFPGPCPAFRWELQVMESWAWPANEVNHEQDEGRKLSVLYKSAIT